MFYTYAKFSSPRMKGLFIEEQIKVVKIKLVLSSGEEEPTGSADGASVQPPWQVIPSEGRAP